MKYQSILRFLWEKADEHNFNAGSDFGLPEPRKWEGIEDLDRHLLDEICNWNTQECKTRLLKLSKITFNRERESKLCS
eukprot:2490195-Rhodomonas_salina.1